MLIKTTPKPGDIIAFKLITGEELIAKLKDISTHKLTVSKPLAIGMSQQGMAFMPFMLGADEDVEMVFSLDMIVTYIDARKELTDAYIQNTTGIVTAAPGQL